MWSQTGGWHHPQMRTGHTLSATSALPSCRDKQPALLRTRHMNKQALAFAMQRQTEAGPHQVWLPTRHALHPAPCEQLPAPCLAAVAVMADPPCSHQTGSAAACKRGCEHAVRVPTGKSCHAGPALSMHMHHCHQQLKAFTTPSACQWHLSLNVFATQLA